MLKLHSGQVTCPAQAWQVEHRHTHPSVRAWHWPHAYGPYWETSAWHHGHEIVGAVARRTRRNLRSSRAPVTNSHARPTAQPKSTYTVHFIHVRKNLALSFTMTPLCPSSVPRYPGSQWSEIDDAPAGVRFDGTPADARPLLLQSRGRGSQVRRAECRMNPSARVPRCAG